MITGWYVLNKHLVLNKHPSSSLSRTDLIITLASTGTLHENTTWPENAENVQIFTCRLPIIVLHIFMKQVLFPLIFELGAQPFLAYSFTNEKHKKVGLWCTTHMLVSLTMSQAQTACHKMAVPRAMFLQFSNTNFEQTWLYILLFQSCQH